MSSYGQPETPEQPGGDDNGEPDTPAPGGNGRYLVLYASRTNNTGRVAQLIQTTFGCDLLEVEPETPYDNDYNAMLERSQEELAAIRQGDYPPVKTTVENFDVFRLVPFQSDLAPASAVPPSQGPAPMTGSRLERQPQAHTATGIAPDSHRLPSSLRLPEGQYG